MLTALVGVLVQWEECQHRRGFFSRFNWQRSETVSWQQRIGRAAGGWGRRLRCEVAEPRPRRRLHRVRVGPFATAVAAAAAGRGAAKPAAWRPNFFVAVWEPGEGTTWGPASEGPEVIRNDRPDGRRATQPEKVRLRRREYRRG
jgi:hypothetical protein